MRGWPSRRRSWEAQGRRRKGAGLPPTSLLVVGEAAAYRIRRYWGRRGRSGPAAPPGRGDTAGRSCARGPIHVASRATVYAAGREEATCRREGAGPTSSQLGGSLRALPWGEKAARAIMGRPRAGEGVGPRCRLGMSDPRRAPGWWRWVAGVAARVDG